MRVESGTRRVGVSGFVQSLAMVLGLGFMLCSPPALGQWRDAIADSWIEESAPNANHGNDSELSVQGTPGDNYRALIQFDMSGIPLGANVTSTELRLRVTNADTSGLSVHLYRVTQSWSEGGVTWANASANYDASTLYGSFVPDSTGWIRIDITALVQAWVCDQYPDFGLMLVPTGSNEESRYGSREWGSTGQRPRLRVDTSGTNPCIFPAAASYSLEEDAWTGAPGEVIDASGNGMNGMVIGGASNDATTPAIPTDPGTCRYADFDGVDDYIEVPDDPLIDVSNNLTVSAWVNARSLPTGGGLHTIASKDWNFEFHINSAGQVYWWWNDSGGTTRTLTTAASLVLSQWYHITITYTSGAQVIYIDGVPAATSFYTGQLRVNDLPFFVGTDWNFIARAFDGFIDEVNVYRRALSAAEVVTLMAATHPCPVNAAEFSINHDNFGIHCIAETITVDVVDAVAGTPLNSYNALVELDTQSGNGTWTLLSGGGSFNDAMPDDGIATYDWPLGESQAVFALSYTQGTPILDIDVFQISDPGIRDNDAEGNLVFSANGFTLTAAPLGNPPPAVIPPFDVPQTAAVPFDVHITAYGQTPNDPQCGVIESYTGNKSLKFWSQYLDPGTGFLAVDIDGAAIATSEAAAAAQTVVFTNGQAQVTGEYDDVGLKQILVKDDTTINAELPLGIRGATAGFVVRPMRFVLSNIENAPGTLVNPQAVDANGPIFIAAGTPFRATVTALDADGDATPNYGRESTPETVRLDVQLFAPVGGAAPPVSAAVGFAPFAGGAATGLDFIWPEVGIMQLNPGVGDADYLGAGDVVGDLSERVGRFIPDHFATSLNTPMFATACTAGNFSYTGEAFSYLTAPLITATARAATNTTTLNYTGAFFKLATGTSQNRSYTANAALDESGLPLPAADPVVSEAGPGVAELLFSSGAGLSFTKGAPAAAFDADIDVALDVIDSDGVAAAANPVTFAGILFNAGPEIRYGRLRFVNAVGSERVDLALPLRAEYYGGAAIGFVTNFADSCASNVALGFSQFTENLNPGETCVLDIGAPGASNQGCAAPAPLPLQFAEPPLAGDFNLTLQAPGLGNTGSLVVGATVPIWLQFDWDTAVPGDEDPTGQATFGLFSGSGRQIYLREIY